MMSLRVKAIQADPEDNRVLEAALAAGAEFVVSGDKHLLKLVEWKGIQVVSPTQFIERITGRRPAPGK